MDSWEYEFGNPYLPSKLGQAIGAQPRRTEYTRFGGDVPQVLFKANRFHRKRKLGKDKKKERKMGRKRLEEEPESSD